MRKRHPTRWLRSATRGSRPRWWRSWHWPTLARKLLAARLHKLHRKLVADGRSFTRLPLPDQHTARKRLKRLRYLADMTASLWPDKPLRRYLKRLSKAQDALGRHNDVAVAAAAFRDDAARHAEA